MPVVTSRERKVGRNRIWVGTNDNGLVMMEDSKTRHYTYKDGLPASSIRAIAEDGRGNIIVGTTMGLCYIDSSERVIKLNSEHINTKTIIRLVSDRNGFVYHGRVKALADGAREGGLKF